MKKVSPLKDISGSPSGDFNVHVGAPRVEAYFDVRLVPLRAFPDNDPLWGVYRSNGRLIEAAAYMRGPGRQLLGQSEQLSGTHDFVRVRETGVYGGFAQLHFGHYILSTLSRFWVNFRTDFPNAKIYIHIIGSFDDWIDRPFVKQTLLALGYEKDDFVPITKSMRLEHLIIPSPAFIEQCQAHTIFADVGLCMSRYFRKSRNDVQRSGSIYLSKEMLNYGVSKVINESDISEVFKNNGIDVVYPEKLSIHEQLSIFSEYENIIGLAGSAFHLSVLSLGGNKITGICDKPVLNSNFLMIDKIKNNHATYLYPDTGFEHLGSTDSFQNIFRVNEAQAVGEAILSRLP